MPRSRPFASDRTPPEADFVRLSAGDINIMALVHLSPDSTPARVEARIGPVDKRVHLEVSCNGNGALVRASTHDPALCTDVVTLLAGSAEHQVWSRRTESGDVAELTWRRVYNGVPISLSDASGPVCEQAWTQVWANRAAERNATSSEATPVRADAAPAKV